ncbi:DUF3899 domain-containing protein [Bacillus tianshenii]|uniref:DUF3899 domain-containing protein n=1 Tax=Sutcliffiella tianshenii TaxID=1463404 RepID=UPI001CD5C45F|nr:DUF3899 domain-containing protein [Bacillus tianshenii]MCA1320081.1 DUF3899 domain-containing protein [Bacillus tianshenii]
MNKTIKTAAIYFLVLLILTICAGYFYYGTFSLLVFINTSFFFSGITLFFTMLILVTQKGFFDAITYGFRKIFAAKQADKQLEEDSSTEMRNPSELLDSINVSPLLIGALLLLVCMLIGLVVFYNS